MRRIFGILAVVVTSTLLLGGLAGASIVVVTSEKSYPANVLFENGRPVVSVIGGGSFTVFKLAENGSIKWAVSGGDFVPLSSDLLHGPFYSPEGFGSAVAKAPDGGILLGFTVVTGNATFYPALMKISSNGSLEWAYVYRLGINVSPWVDSVFAWDDGILISGHTEKRTNRGTESLPLLILLKPNGTVVWVRAYHIPLLTGTIFGEALEVNGSYAYILQGESNMLFRTMAVVLRLDENGNVTKVNSIVGMDTVSSAAFDGRYLYLLGVDENGTVLAKLSLRGDNTIWAKEYSIGFNYANASCSQNETNITMISSKVVSSAFKHLLHVEKGLEVFPMPFELGLRLGGVPCNGSILEQEASLKPVKVIFKADGNGDLLSKKVLLLNSTYLVESFDYSEGTFALSMTKSLVGPMGVVEPKPLILIGNFNDTFNLSIARDADLNVTVRDASVHLGDVHFSPAHQLSEEVSVSVIPVKPVNAAKNVPKGIKTSVYKTEASKVTKTTETEKPSTSSESTAPKKTTKELCGPAFIVALSILPAILLMGRK